MYSNISTLYVNYTIGAMWLALRLDRQLSEPHQFMFDGME